MNKIKIVVDSTGDFTKEEIEQYDLEVVSLIASVDGKSYNYSDINNEEYIEKMSKSDSFFTSQPPIGNFLDVYEKWTKLGYTVISLHLTYALSGTYNTACSAASEFENVHVVNSKTTSRGLLYLVEYCDELIKENLSIDEIISKIKERRSKIFTYNAIDKLDNLVKGGRVKKSQALIGGLLNIKVLTKVIDTELVVVDKVRGRKKLLISILNALKEDIKDLKIKRISLPHTSIKHAIELKDAIKEQFNYGVLDSEIIYTTPAISVHSGLGAVGIIMELE